MCAFLARRGHAHREVIEVPSRSPAARLGQRKRRGGQSRLNVNGKQPRVVGPRCYPLPFLLLTRLGPGMTPKTAFLKKRKRKKCLRKNNQTKAVSGGLLQRVPCPCKDRLPSVIPSTTLRVTSGAVARKKIGVGLWRGDIRLRRSPFFPPIDDVDAMAGRECRQALRWVAICNIGSKCSPSKFPERGLVF